MNNREDWSTKGESVVVKRGKAARLVERFVGVEHCTPHLLDVGSGSGFFIETLSARFSADVADRRDFLSDSARTRVKSFTALDLNTPWPFQSGSYDAVSVWNVLEHLENPFHFAREASRVLKPGGFLFVSIPNVLNVKSRLSFLCTGNMTRYHSENSHITPFTKATLIKIFSTFTLRKTGFIGYEFPIFAQWRIGGLFKRFFKSSEWFGHTLYLILQKCQ